MANLFVICDTGARFYEAQVFLNTKGITDTLHMQSGYVMIKVTEPDF